MGLFDALGKVGKAAVGTAMLPVDAARDAVGLVTEDIESESKVAKRGRKIAKNLDEAVDEIDE